MKIKCPICEQIYGREEWMIEEEKYPSLLGLAEWHIFYCEWCGAKLEVKLAKDIEKEVKKEINKKERMEKLLNKSFVVGIILVILAGIGCHVGIIPLYTFLGIGIGVGSWIGILTKDLMDMERF